MTRWAVLFLPVLGIVAVDPVAFDFFALKYVALVAGTVVCLLLALERRRLAWSNVSLALWVFVAARGIALLRAPHAGRALRWWCLLVALTLCHHAACATTTRRWLRRWAVPAITAVAVAAALLATGQALFGARQAHAFFANRNFAGVALAMMLPFALAMPGRARWPFAAVVGVGLLCTSSRTGWLAGAAAGALWLLWTRPRLRWPLLGVPAVVLAVGLAFGDSNTVKVRLHWYRAALAMGLDQPLLGVGADGFAREYPPVRPLEEHQISGGRKVHAVHNDYLESFAEGGALGLAAHLFLLVAAARAVWRHRAAAACLLAFAVGSLVDLPLRDPSLLALAFLPLAMAARRRTLRIAPVWTHVPAAAALAAGLFLVHLPHWRADRLVGRYFATRDAGLLEQALELEPRHPEALQARGSRADLEALLTLDPHNANALLRSARLHDADEPSKLREILAHHDRHHVMTRVWIAQQLLADHPPAAVPVLEAAIEADPRPFQPYVLLARIYREGGQPEAAHKYLRAAEMRSKHYSVINERFFFESGEARAGRWHRDRLIAAIRGFGAERTALRVEDALLEAQAIEEKNPPPPVARKEGEEPLAYAKRIQEARAEWRRGLEAMTRSHYLEALLVAEALTVVDRRPPYFRLLSRAARGLGDVTRATQMEALALLLETLDAARAGDETRARARLKRALRAYPKLTSERAILDAVKQFAKEHPAAVPFLRDLFRPHPALLERLQR